MSAIAGHPKAIRIAGRRMSQSGGAPIKSPSSAKGPGPSTSPEDGLDDIFQRTPSDYPRPSGPPEMEKDDDEGSNKDDDSPRRRKKEQQRKKGMSSEEARMRKAEANPALSKGGQGRRMSNTAGMRITQPAGKTM